MSVIPPTFLLIRHAEKLTWPTGISPGPLAKLNYEDDHQLSSKGLERSHALVGYFLHRQEMLDIYAKAPLAAIVCQGVNPTGKGKSERPKQTIYPLFEHLALASSSSFAINASAAAAATAGTGYVSSLGSDHTYHPSRSTASLMNNNNAPVQFLEYTKAQFGSMVRHLTSAPEFSGKTVIISWSHQTLPHLAVALGVPSEQVPGKWGKRFDVTWVISKERELKQWPQRLLFGDLDDGIKLKSGGASGQIQQETLALLGGGGDDSEGDEDD
ncbi:hypothetical protein BDR26DRAFT_866206 [Obelidium mucronatum]|nr:hypothetical protein BDR26DRAFT_866206 [Obelidium mucronatum]